MPRNWRITSEFEIFYLSKFKITPREYKARFDNATKRPDETFIYLFFCAAQK